MKIVHGDVSHDGLRFKGLSEFHVVMELPCGQWVWKNVACRDYYARCQDLSNSMVQSWLRKPVLGDGEATEDPRQVTCLWCLDAMHRVP